MRVIALALGSVVLIAICMWLRFALKNLWVYLHMPPALREEFAQLRQHPVLDLARYHQIIDGWWGIYYSDPSIASNDWLTVGVLVIMAIPFIVMVGLRVARPLSTQFSRLATAARAVAEGQFGTTADLVENAPQELVQFTEDFNLMTQQLARYERELRASHVAMAHELRSPLTAAIGRLQGMMDGVFDPDPQQLSMVMKQLRQLSRLTDELHLLSLADAGQLSLECSKIQLVELLRERAAWLAPQAAAAGMVIEIEAKGNARFAGDTFRLGQVFTILMENTLRYAPEGERLTITITQHAAQVNILFRDYGSGVDPQFLPILFDRFTRAESSRARHSGGSGLGLSIARAIVVAHGGEVSASLPADGGLEIALTLPLLSES